MSLTYVQTQRSNLFYNQYRYAGKFHIQHVNLLRELDVTAMQATVARRNQYNTWRWQSNSTRPQPAQLQALRDLIDPLVAYRTAAKLAFHDHWLYVYTNDASILSRLTQFPQVLDTAVTEVEVICPPNTICLRKPRHKFRSYFQAGWVEDFHRQALLKFLGSREQQFYITPALRERMQLGPRRIYMPYRSFVEHSTMQDLTMLCLTFPYPVKRTMTIQAK